MNMTMELIDNTTLITNNYKEERMLLESCRTLVDKELYDAQISEGLFH